MRRKAALSSFLVCFGCESETKGDEWTSDLYDWWRSYLDE